LGARVSRLVVVFLARGVREGEKLVAEGDLEVLERECAHSIPRGELRLRAQDPVLDGTGKLRRIKRIFVPFGGGHGLILPCFDEPVKIS
jgi:hypothetical protein